MSHQKLFKTGFIAKLKEGLGQTDTDTINLYKSKNFNIEETSVLQNLHIEEKQFELLIPDKKSNYDFENAHLIFEHLKELSPVQATDDRMWTYMAHVNFWEYMHKRWPINFENPEANKYILQHWFVDGVSAKNLMRHGIATLWWTAYMTFDAKREDPYELTKEVYSMLDYTRTLLPGKLGRNQNFRHALLEFIVENKEIFKDFKQDRVRELMVRMNFLASYRKIYSLNKDEIKEILGKYKDEIKKIKGR